MAEKSQGWGLRRSENPSVIIIMNSYLDRAGDVQALLHARDIQLNDSQIFAFYNDGTQRAHKPAARQEERAS